MAAVGLSDVFKYGARFLAHLLVVVLLGVAVVLLGDVVGEFTTGTASDPAIRENLGTTAYVGIAISVAGVLVTVAGLGGLLFKLVADGTAVGTRSVLAEADGFDESSEEAEGDDEQDTAEATSEDTTPSESPATSPGPSGDQSRPSQQPTETPAPAPEESVNHFSQEQPTASQDPASPEPAGQQPTAAESFDQPAGQQSTASNESDRTSQTGPAQDVPSPQPEQETATRSPEPAGDGTTGDQSDEQSNPDEPPEWTPPDPDEFERQQSEKAAERGQQDPNDAVGQSSSDTEAVDQSSRDASVPPADGQRQDSFDDDTRLVDEDQFDDADSGATTWDDLQSPTESTTAEQTDDTVSEESQPTTEDWGSPEQFADESETRVETERESDDATDENGYDDDEISNDDDDGFSFETSGDSDPLSDALDEN